jgi:hypothetical protein
LSHNIVGTAAVYGYASQPSENSLKGSFEKGILAHPVELSF